MNLEEMTKQSRDGFKSIPSDLLEAASDCLQSLGSSISFFSQRERAHIEVLKVVEDMLDPEMARRDIVELREKVIKYLHSVGEKG